jgi:hypothetical protein
MHCFSLIKTTRLMLLGVHCSVYCGYRKKYINTLSVHIDAFRCQGLVVRMAATEICIMYLLLQHLSWVVQELLSIVL